MAARPSTNVLIALLLALASPALAAEPASPPPTSIRQLHLDVTVQEDGTAVQTLHIETAVANNAAAQQNAQFTMTFSDAIERLEVIEAYTQKPDGQRIPIDSTGIRTQLAPGVANLPLYSDRKQIVAVFPDAQGGDVFVSTWRRTITQPIIPGEFAASSLFVRTLPWNDAQITITTPADKPLHTEAHGPTLDESTAADGRHVYHWHYSTSDALPEDPAALAPLDRAPRVFASTFPDWAAFSRAYAALVAPQAAVTPRLQALADEVTSGVADRREQAQRLYDWVGQHVRWVAIYLGNGPFVPHAADAVLANGYGDCKDQVTLLIALLRAKGIAAEPVLVNLGPSYTLSGPATYTAFNHLITYLPQWGTYADTTPGGAPFGTLPLAEYGKPVLRITTGGEAPGRLPQVSPGAATERLRTAATLGPDGTVTGTSTTDAVGPYAIALHFAVQTIQARGSEQMAARQLRTLGESGKGDFTRIEADGAGPGASVEGRFTLDPHPEWLEGDAFLPPTGLRLLARTGDALIGPMRERNLPATEPTPCYAGRQEEELSLTLPPGHRPAHLPKDTTVESSFFHYESHWSFVNGVVTVQRSLVSTFDQPFCDGASRAEAARALPAIRRDLDTRISLEAAE